jgi:hypothetical protein
MNAYCNAKMAYRKQGMKRITHLEFRKAHHRELFKQGSEEPRQRKRRHSSIHHQIKVIMTLKGFIPANGAISVWYASKEQRLEVIQFQSNFTQYIAVRPASRGLR